MLYRHTTSFSDYPIQCIFVIWFGARKMEKGLHFIHSEEILDAFPNGLVIVPIDILSSGFIDAGRALRRTHRPVWRDRNAGRHIDRCDRRDRDQAWLPGGAGD